MLAAIRYDEILSKTAFPLDRYSRITHLYNVIKNDYLINKCNDQYLVSFDESLTNNLGSCFEELEKRNPEFFYLLMKKRKIVFLDTSPEVAAERILKRYELAGRKIPEHKNLSFKDLVTQVRGELEEKRSIVSWLQSKGVECLSINTEEKVELNAVKVENFISKLQ